MKRAFAIRLPCGLIRTFRRKAGSFHLDEPLRQRVAADQIAGLIEDLQFRHPFCRRGSNDNLGQILSIARFG
ncbi:hypothetical protein G6M50_10915 [Agrobacterium rhizogenes]|jgi:hypothetical protein|nr:hypothetical protein [Rhizobium rhizogenes]NTJ78293.1 hypothetical protein [Rhizobium rhizogenes]